MTLDQAVTRLRAIDADLAAGRLTVPYPEPIEREIAGLAEIISAHCQTSEQARELVQRISGSGVSELPW
jgi:hypothetical protein